MKRLHVVLLLVFLVSFVIFKQVIFSIDFSKMSHETEPSLKNYTQPTVASASKVHQVTQSKSANFNESDFCASEEGGDISDVCLQWRSLCPINPILTVSQLGRLGNQLWEYACLWGVAKSKNRQPFAPSCLTDFLGSVFKNLTTIPSLRCIEYCPIKFDSISAVFLMNLTRNSVVLPAYCQLPEYVVPYLDEIRELYQFHDHITEKSQDILRNASAEVTDPVFVGVHVRRTDYGNQLKFLYDETMTLANATFFLRQMDYFRKMYSSVVFVILSDDPDWCERELRASDAVVVRGNEPAQDLSLLASCNHSIIDYGTFGLWGAMLSGGETLHFKLPPGLEMHVSKLMPNWHAVT